MDDFQKSVFIEYYFNSIDFIAKETRADLIIDTFDAIVQEFNLDKKTKEFMEANFNPYKNIENRKIELTKEFFKKELLEIKKTLKPRKAQSYRTLKKIKKENCLNNEQFKLLTYYDFAAKNYAFLKLIQAIDNPTRLEFFFLPILLKMDSKKVIKSFDKIFTKKLIKIKHDGSSKYIAYFTPFDKSTKAYENFENIAYKYNKAV